MIFFYIKNIFSVLIINGSIKIGFLIFGLTFFGFNFIKAETFQISVDTSFKSNLILIDTISGINYNPYSGFYSSVTHIRFKHETDTSIHLRYLVRNYFDFDTLDFKIFNHKTGLFSYKKVKRKDSGEVILEDSFEGKIQLLDTITIKDSIFEYNLYLFKVNTEKNIFTIYYSDELGVFKQYCSDSYYTFEDRTKNDLLNFTLKEIYLNPNFHQRFDSGPRTISGILVDYSLVYKRGNRKIKRKIDDVFIKEKILTPCQVGYLYSCY